MNMLCTLHKMTAFKNILFLLVFSISINCSGQNEEIQNRKILEINNLIEIFYSISTINFEELEERLNYVSKEKIDKLKEYISKESLDSKIIKLFKENFSTQEINELHIFYSDEKNYKTPDPVLKQLLKEEYVYEINEEQNLSPELKNKRDTVFEHFFQEGQKAFIDFKNEFYILDSINYETLKNIKKVDNSTKNEFNRVNGIYEALYYSRDQDQKAYISSFKIKKEPGILFDNLKDVKVVHSDDGSFCYYVELSFDEKDSQKLLVLTSNNEGEPLAIVVDGEILTAPYVNCPIADGNVCISGNMTLEEAKSIMFKIKKSIIKKVN